MTMVVELLTDLLSRPSVTPLDEGCQALVASLLIDAGFSATPLTFGRVENLWATHGTGSPVFCFAGHTDVVPPGPAEAWTSPPFEPTSRDGNLYGRGAADMKGSVAAMVVALIEISKSGHPGTVALLLTSDEEGPGIDGTSRVLAHLQKQGITIDAAVVGEPTCDRILGDTIKSGRRGSVNGNLVVHGKQGHTAFPHLAENALHRLAPALAALVGKDWGEGNADFPPTSFQISNLHSGTGATNVIPGTAELNFNIRFGTDWKVSDIQQRVEALLREHGLEDTVDWQTSALPFLTEAGPLVGALRSAVSETTGIHPQLSTTGGTSDARFFAAHGIPVAEFGPINASIHAVDECIAIRDLEKLPSVYRRVIEIFFEK
jgi:succinyl-diaminopimelate desuccinylase